MLALFLLGLASGALVLALTSRHRACTGPARRAYHFHPGQLLAAAHQLHLDPMQREQVKDILRTMERLGLDVRMHVGERMDALGQAMRGERFDRAALDGLVATQLEEEASLRREAFDRLELLYNGLTAEQREKLHDLLGTGERSQPPAPTAG